MVFDITTPDCAYQFIQEFFGITGEELIEEYVIRCNNDFEEFWDRHIEYIRSYNIENIKYKVIHVTSNWDECMEIRTMGIKNLQKVLSESNNFSSLLLNNGVHFDLNNRVLYSDNEVIDIDYDKYRKKIMISTYEKKIREVARKVYYDYQINGFFSNNNVRDYGTEIHRRPEFLLNLTDILPQKKEIEDIWRKNSKGYIVSILAELEQFAWYSFYENVDEYLDDKDNNMYQFKKWIIEKAIGRSFEDNDTHSEILAYMDSNTIIRSEQIVEYYEIKECTYFNGRSVNTNKMQKNDK